MKNDFDAIVIGARVAGAMTAGLLASSGYSVLLIDQTTFPRDTVSAPILWGNALQSLDIIRAGSIVDACGFPRISRIRRVSHNQTIIGHMLPIGGRDYGLGVSRLRLDAVLLSHIQTLPQVHVREGFTVQSLIYEGQSVVGIEGYQGHQNQRRERFSSTIVIGADGIHSTTARLVKAPIYRSDPPQYFQYYAFFESFRDIDTRELVTYYLPSCQSLLIFPIEGNTTVVSWSIPAHYLPVIRGQAHTAFKNAWQSVPELRDKGQNVTQTTKLMGRLPVSSFFRQPWGNGWALVGDAGFYTDPSGGRGFYDAFRSAELLVHAFIQFLEGRKWEEAMRIYQISRDLEFDSSYRYIRASNDREVVDLAMLHHLKQSAQTDPAMTDILVSLNKAIPAATILNTADHNTFMSASELASASGQSKGKRGKQ